MGRLRCPTMPGQKACTYCKKYGPFCIPGWKQCLNQYQGGPPVGSSGAPEDKSRIVRRAHKTGRINPVGYWIVEREMHPYYKKKKPILRNNARQKRKERGKIQASPR